MNKNTLIIAVNLIVLLTSVLIFRSLDITEEHNFIFYFSTWIVLVVFNSVKSVICFYKGETPKAKTFVLSGLLVLIIGSSSCVSIRFRNKEPKIKQSVLHNPNDTIPLKQK